MALLAVREIEEGDRYAETDGDRDGCRHSCIGTECHRRQVAGSQRAGGRRWCRGWRRRGSGGGATRRKEVPVMDERSLLRIVAGRILRLQGDNSSASGETGS